MFEVGVVVAVVRGGDREAHLKQFKRGVSKGRNCLHRHQCPLFSHKYDISSSICLKFCRLPELSKVILLDFKFYYYSKQNQNNCLLLKNKRSIV